MKYFINNKEHTEVEILDILFNAIEPRNPTTISFLFHSLMILVDENPDKAKYRLEALMVDSNLLDYKQHGYFYQLTLKPKGLLALQKHGSYSRYKEELEKEQPKEQNKTTTTNTHVGDVYGNSILTGHGSSLSDLNKPATHTTTNNNPHNPPKKSVIEIFSWIIGIIVGLISLYAFVLKKFFH